MNTTYIRLRVPRRLYRILIAAGARDGDRERAVYQMNPAEDYVIFGGELAEGMWVIPQAPDQRNRVWPDKDEFLRGQRFRRVTDLRHDDDCAVFIAEWADRYQ